MNKNDIRSNGRINNAAQMFGIKRYTLNGGAEDGLRVIECTNGALRFLLNESKALDIMQIFYKGENTSFVSKNGFTKRETSFSERFEGGALYTCGLDAAGVVEGKEMHGGFHNIPATVLRAECGDKGITVEAPKDNEPESCYYLKPVDRTVYYFNPKSGRKFTLKYSDNLDKFVLWKSNASGDYALGLEPSTTELDGEFAYKQIAAGESKTFCVSYAIE
ncbi:MAG: DUF4432 family protein [Christensenellaceae bacterium]